VPDRLKPFGDLKSKAALEPSDPFHAMASDSVPSKGEIAFGPFRLLVAERLLLKDEVPLELGGRTLDTLIALATRPNEVISKRELLAQVWPDVVVEEGSLRFHVAALRKVLGDGENGARYIATSAGRGYCFFAKVATRREVPSHVASGTLARSSALPHRLLRMVGRADGIVDLSTHLAAQRFVTITGAGGVGKTTVAVAIANDLTDAFSGDVLFYEDAGAAGERLEKELRGGDYVVVKGSRGVGLDRLTRKLKERLALV